MGNSEVGHLTLGAGAVVMQDLTRIDDAARSGRLAENPVLSDADIAIASRYVSGNGVGEWNRFRLFVSRCGTLATAPLQRNGLKVKDPLAGFFVVRRECIDGISLQPEGFKILLEILVKGRITKAVEVPYHFGNRHSGKSKADVKVALQYFSLLGKLSRYALFGSSSGQHQ